MLDLSQVKLTAKQKAEKLNRLQSMLLDNKKRMQRYRDKNKIYFIGNEGESGLNFNPLQQRIINAWTNTSIKTFAYTGSNRLGKTWISAVLAVSTVFGEFPWNKQDLLFLHPHNKPRKVKYIGQSWNDHIQKVVIPKLYELWPDDRKVLRHGNGIITDTTWIDVKTESRIDIMSNKQDPGMHEGDDYDLIIFDEPPTRDVFIANARGLVDRSGRSFFAMTLLKEAWVHQEIIKRLNPDGTPDRTVFAVDGDITYNIGYGITAEGVAEFEKTLTPEERKARIEGKPTYLSGLVCGDFDRHTHIIDRFPIPSDWPVDIAIDVHPRKEQAVLFTATSPQQIRYCCFEIWAHGDGPQLADMIIRVANYNALRINRIIIDPLAKGDGNNTNTVFDKMAEVFMRHGHVLETANKDKVNGILAIKTHLKGPNGQPSIFFFSDLRVTIKQIEGWMFDDDEKPSKKNDDMCENLYRTLLVDTEYSRNESSDYEDEWDDFIHGASGGRASVNPVTGF